MAEGAIGSRFTATGVRGHWWAQTSARAQLLVLQVVPSCPSSSTVRAEGRDERQTVRACPSDAATRTSVRLLTPVGYNEL